VKPGAQMTEHRTDNPHSELVRRLRNPTQAGSCCLAELHDLAADALERQEMELRHLRPLMVNDPLGQYTPEAFERLRAALEGVWNITGHIINRDQYLEAVNQIVEPVLFPHLYEALDSRSE